MEREKTDWKRYIIVLIITSVIFFTALYISDLVNQKRIVEIQKIEEQISIDILSLETQFALLGELSCEDINENTILSQELNSLAQRLTYAESQSGFDREEIERIKKRYSLLQIKDYLLMKQITEQCDLNPVFILHFYSNFNDCKDCIRASHALGYLRDKYPTLRVYSFDYHLDLSALKTLIAINNVEDSLPVIISGGEAYYGITTLKDLEDLIPRLETLEVATSTATTTTSTTTKSR